MLSTGDRVLQKKNMPSTSWSLGAAQPNVFEQAITRPVGWVSPNGKCGNYQPMAKSLDGARKALDDVIFKPRSGE